MMHFLYYAGYHRKKDEEQIGLATSVDLKTWTRPRVEPVVPLGSTGDADRAQTSNPCVMIHDGLFKMWYQGKSMDGILSICYAESPDGISWNFRKQPVLAIADISHKEHRLGYHHPHVLFDQEQKLFRMWFIKFKDKSSSLCYAESADGISWGAIQESILFSAASWEGKYIYYPCILKDGSLFKMWYTARADNGQWAVGYAESPDGIAWKKSDRNPIVFSTTHKPFVRRLFEIVARIIHREFVFPLYGVASPCVWKEGDVYYLITHNVGTHGKLFLQLYSSADGLTWLERERNFLRKGSGVWDYYFQADPFMVTLPR